MDDQTQPTTSSATEPQADRADALPAQAGDRGDRDPLRASRTSRSWAWLTALVVVLILLVIFIAQNTQRVEVSFLGWNGHPPLSVALLVAAVGGATLAVIVGTLRMWQVRRRVRRAGPA